MKIKRKRNRNFRKRKTHKDNWELKFYFYRMMSKEIDKTYKTLISQINHDKF